MKLDLHPLLKATCAALAALVTVPATALQVFDDKATFLAATQASSATGPLPVVAGFATSLVAGTVTVTTPNGAALVIGQSSPSHFGTPLLPGNEITLVGLEHINYALSAPVYSLGFDFAEPDALSGCGVTCIDSTFTVTLRSAGSAVGGFSFNAPNAVATFVGLWSDLVFDRVEVRETAGGIDSEFFGEVFTGTISPVPELPAGWMLGAALPMLAGRLWQRGARSSRRLVRPRPAPGP